MIELTFALVIIPTVAGLQRALDEHCQRYNDKPNIALRYLCPKTRKSK
ncbi:MAG: hypothetical protein K0U15_01355 [Proteobacteria bacterium]|nr:hypothetical protein [Pseudomonadota bacterium]